MRLVTFSALFFLRLLESALLGARLRVVLLSRNSPSFNQLVSGLEKAARTTEWRVSPNYRDLVRCVKYVAPIS
jgi:hypothetical protein